VTQQIGVHHSAAQHDRQRHVTVDWTRLGIQRVQACTRWHFAFALRCHSNATRAPIANPPNSAQLGGIPYHSPKLHLGPCSSVGMRPRTARQTRRQTHRRAWSLYISRRLYDSREM